MGKIGKIIYVVTEEATGSQRLVRANNKTQAVGFVAHNSFCAKRATQDQLVALLAEGLKVEDTVKHERPAA